MSFRIFWALFQNLKNFGVLIFAHHGVLFHAEMARISRTSNLGTSRQQQSQSTSF
jgi:hypothetical protein